jgi:hypothetical protein
MGQIAKIFDGFQANHRDLQVTSIGVLGPDFFDEGFPDAVRVLCKEEGQMAGTL